MSDTPDSLLVVVPPEEVRAAADEFIRLWLPAFLRARTRRTVAVTMAYDHACVSDANWGVR